MPAPTPLPYGLNRGNVILEVNGIKLGSPYLMRLNQSQNLMKSVLVLKILMVRKPDFQDSSLVSSWQFFIVQRIFSYASMQHESFPIIN